MFLLSRFIIPFLSSCILTTFNNKLLAVKRYLESNRDDDANAPTMSADVPERECRDSGIAERYLQVRIRQGGRIFYAKELETRAGGCRAVDGGVAVAADGTF